MIASSIPSPQLDRHPSGWPSVGAATLKTDTGSSSVGNMAAARASTPHKVSSRAGGRSKMGTCWNCSLNPCAGRMTSRFQANAQGQWCTQDCAPTAEGDGESTSLEHFACHARCWPIDNGRTKQSLRLSRRELGASASKRGWHQAASRSNALVCDATRPQQHNLAHLCPYPHVHSHATTLRPQQMRRRITLDIGGGHSQGSTTAAAFLIRARTSFVCVSADAIPW